MSKAETDWEATERRIRELEERESERMAELMPGLDVLVSKAKRTYELLRPKAKHIGSVAIDYPLRHQQVHGLNPMEGVGDVVSDYLMIGLEGDRSLVLYHNLVTGNGTNFAWRLVRRTAMIDERTSDETRVHEFIYPRGDWGNLDIEVISYYYPEEMWLNATCTDIPCRSSDYEGAEQYIEEFTADLDQSLTKYS